MATRFWKVESIGNDFPLIHLDDIPSEQLPALAIRLCDRRFGIGGDGLLAIGLEPGDLAEGELRLRMFNPDGTEDFCGNGLRCAARHAHSQGWVGEAFTIHHLDQVVPVRLDRETITTELAPASYRPEAIPAIFETQPKTTYDRVVWTDGYTTLRGSTLSTGTTHTVIPGPLPDDEVFLRLSPLVEVAPQFPERSSVMWTETVGPLEIRLRIWERGVGETQGCGTGSSAAAIDTLRRAGTGGSVLVHNPGGTLRITAESWEGAISISGIAHEVFSGHFEG